MQAAHASGLMEECTAISEFIETRCRMNSFRWAGDIIKGIITFLLVNIMTMRLLNDIIINP